MSFIYQLLDTIIAWPDRRREKANARAEREHVKMEVALERNGNSIAKNYADLFNYRNSDPPLRCIPILRKGGIILPETAPLPFDMALPMSPGTCPISKSYNDAQFIHRSILDADYRGPIHFDVKRHAYIVSFATKNELLIFKLTYGGE
jgi:hypothetical protein